MKKNTFRSRPRAVKPSQQGFSLVIVLLLLVIVSLLGVASMQIAMMSERGARNDRDMQLAWQGAEAALVDAELDLSGPNTSAQSRTATILSNPPVLGPNEGCHTGASDRGFCSTTTAGQTKPSWLVMDFTDTSATAPTVAFGTFTGRTFDNAGNTLGLGIQPAEAPRYMIEDVSTADASNAGGGMVTPGYTSAGAAGTKTNRGRVYRVTAMGFGPRGDIQAVLQTIYRN